MWAGSIGSGASPEFRKKWDRFFGCDLRSLAALRIAIASVILLDLALRLPEIDLFYTDHGLLPRSINPTPLAVFPLSVHGYAGSYAFELLLFIVAFGFAAMMLVGYRTRLATAVSWWLLASLHFRNPEIGNGGDAWLRMTLFWSLFAPLGARWSIDARRHLRLRQLPTSDTVLSMVTVALLLQPAMIYFFTALLKLQSGPEWFPDFSAIYLSLRHVYWTWPLGLWLLEFPRLLQVMTLGVFALELIGPFLLFCPVFTARIRGLTVLAFVALQLGLASTMQLYLFPWASILALLPFVPAGFWQRLARLARRTRLAQPEAAAAGPRVGEPVDAPPHRSARRLVREGVLLTLVLYVLFNNVTTIAPRFEPRGLVLWATWLGQALGLSQEWAMFAPPQRVEWNLLLLGNLSDGSRRDVLVARNDESWEEIRSLHQKIRFKIFYLGLASDLRKQERLAYVRWMCAEWNGAETRGPTLLRVELVTRERAIPRGDATPDPWQERILMRHGCESQRARMDTAG